MMVVYDLQTEENIELILPENAPPSFHLLAKPTGNEMTQDLNQYISAASWTSQRQPLFRNINSWHLLN